MARLIASTTERLRQLTAEGPLSEAQRSRAEGAMQGAIRRTLTGRAVQWAQTGGMESYGFLGALPTPAVVQMATVDPSVNQNALSDARDRTLAAMERATAQQTRLVQLLAGPGGELQATQRVAELRIESAQRQFAITKDRGKLEAEIDGARLDRELSIAELRRRQLEEYRDTSRGVYRALVAGGGGGLRDFVRGQGLALGEQLFVNASSKGFQTLGPMLGKVGGALNLPGWLTAGTMFDPQNQQMALQSNTAVTMDNTAALRQLNLNMTRMATGGAGAVFGGVGGTLAGLGGGLSADPSQWSNDTWMEIMAPGSVPSGKKGLSTTAKIAGYAAMAAGGFGVYSGVKQGGWAGATTAGASAAGMVAMLPTLMPAIGKALPMLGPIGAIASIGLGLVGAFMPNRRQQFDKNVNSALDTNRWTMPDSTSYSLDTSGFEVDYNFRGQVRAGKQIIQHFHIDAIDAKSLMDRKTEIGEVIRQELQSDGPLRTEIADVARYA